MSKPKTLSLSLLLLALAAQPACDRRAPAPYALPASASPAAAAAPAPQLSLFERLAHEAAQRPGARPRADDVQQALAAKGTALARWKQVLASPVGARFCMAGQTAAGVVVAVCEYESPAAAAAGRDRSRALFDRLIPNRLLTVNRTTLLTLTGPPDLDPEAKRLASVFASL